MHEALTILTEELRRLKASGVKSVAVSDASLAALHRAVEARAKSAPLGPRAEVRPPVREVAPVAPPARGPAPAAKLAREVSPPPSDHPASPSGGPTIPAPTPFTLPEGDKPIKLAWLKDRVLNDAVCRTHLRPGKKVVLGVGSLDAKIMFVGEAPGAEEEVQGEPFVGPAGQLLTRMIGGMGLKREEVYIGNIMNWRPEMPLNAAGVQYGNRPPTEDEMRYCLPHLRAQIEIVNPDLLVALGSTAAQGLLGFGTFKALGEVRGRWREFAGKPLMVTYHPSYILRNQSNRSKRMIWEDLLQVMERAGLSISDKQRGYFLDK